MDSFRSAQTAVFQFLRTEGGHASQIYRRMKKVIRFRRCQCYEAGRVNIKDLPRPGQAHVVTSIATFLAVDELIRQNRRMTTREIAVKLSIIKGTVHHIIYKKLRYGKVCAQCVPKHLSENQKTERMGVCLTSSFNTEDIHSLPTRWGQCINVNDDYLQLYCCT
ncbi:hypothetical protein AVEN_225906-1 [Araneus ventricosus]|uniref:Mos1 transposase HTH domain-containing protein n=1 Tax=Araneus ventricosus TaxID=182803 RepID=A0A4Y2BE45_ARAVE|nr:hypothetical protein AVEN_225906-1 [Araneus ventricosus]